MSARRSLVLLTQRLYRQGSARVCRERASQSITFFSQLRSASSTRALYPRTSARSSEERFALSLASLLSLGILGLHMAEEAGMAEAAPSSASSGLSEAAVAAEAKYNDSSLSKEDVLNFINASSAGAPDDIELKWRHARALYDIAQQTGVSQDVKKQKTYEAYEVIKEAIAAQPEHFAVQKWYGIILSEIGSFEGTKASIANAYVIRDAFTKATELNPKDATSRHLLGLWCFNIAGISWMTRQVASAIFGTPPTSSYQEALDNFLKAEALDPGFYKKNAFLITQCYAKLSKNDEAKVWLQKTLQIPVKTDEDKQVHAEAEKFGKSLR